MSNVDLARIQFAATTLFHFLFVPLTIGLSWLVAIMQTAWHRTGQTDWLRLTRFFGKLLLINVAIGVATGLVQEFQFGMNWSTYSRFVGDVFGAPLAIEGLAAFFLESTFLAIWVFGWDKLPRRIHLATIHLAALGATLSAVFILAANSWMQHPVGYTINATTGRAELDSIGAVFTNPVFLWALPHTLLASFVTASFVVVAVAGWHLRRGAEVGAFHRAMHLGLIVLFLSASAGLMTGGRLAVTMTQNQPMKTAAMEAMWRTEAPASFSVFQIGGMSEEDQTPSVDIEIPNLLSILATNTLNGEVQGITPLNEAAQQQYGPGSYIPTIPYAYYGLRVMAYGGMYIAAFSALGLFLLWRRKLTTARWFHRLAVGSVFVPFAVNLGGWVLTETARQPWIVWGLQRTADAASPSVSSTQIAVTVGGFVALYSILAVIDLRLMMRFSRAGLEPAPTNDDSGDQSPSPTPAMSY